MEFEIFSEELEIKAKQIEIELTKEQIIYNYENFDKDKEYQCVDDTLYIHVYIF